MYWFIPVFFNIFAAVEPYTSVKIIHGTSCNGNHVSICSGLAAIFSKKF